MTVIDASIAVAMILDERTLLASDLTFESLAHRPLFAPSHGHAEVGNALVINLRRGRMSPPHLDYALAKRKSLRVTIEQPAVHDDFASIVERAFAAGLTYYDELYVRLAEAGGMALFTFDERLRSVGRARGVQILPE